MPFSPVYIASYDCLSPAGHGVPALVSALMEGRSFLQSGLGELPPGLNSALDQVHAEKGLKDHDRVSLIGIFLARQFSKLDRAAGVIMGSSRGAASSIEESIRSFDAGKRLRPSTSPTTTASSLSSAVARELSLEGPSFFLSAACSTGLYAVIQGATNINAGLADSYLVGGVEAANTEFTKEMMAATKVLSPAKDPYPCKPFAENRSGMILSEGAAMLQLSNFQESDFAIVGVGAATETATLTGVSEQGIALQNAVKQALRSSAISAQDIDLVIGHGAGTVKGDEAEKRAYCEIFGDKIPSLVFHKWCGGHMLGASSALSVILAIEHLKSGLTSPHPYFPPTNRLYSSQRLAKRELALITSMGFGGSATAVVVRNLVP